MFFKKCFFSILIFSLLGQKLYSVPQTFSRWKKSPTSRGSIIIYHDNHQFDQMNPERARDHFKHFLFAIEKFNQYLPSEKLHLLLECIDGSPEKDLLSKDRYFVAHYDSIMLHQFKIFFEKSLFQNVISHNIEFRGNKQIVNAYVGLYDRLLVNEIHQEAQKKIAHEIIKDNANYLKDKSFKYIYTKELKKLAYYKEEAINDQFRKIFCDLEQDLIKIINKMREHLQKYTINEETPITDLLENESMQKKIDFINALNSSVDLWEDLLLETVEAHALYHVMNIPDNESIVIFTGFVHAQRLDQLFSELGYTCMKKVTVSSPEQFQTNCYNELLARDKTCNICHKKIDNPSKCSACKKVYYCSPNCQRQDWIQGHKNLCKKLKE